MPNTKTVVYLFTTLFVIKTIDMKKTILSSAPYLKILFVATLIVSALAFRNPYEVQNENSIVQQLDTVPNPEVNINIDMSKIMAEVNTALASINFEKIMEDVQQSLKKIDFEKMQTQIQQSLATIDYEKMQKDIETSLKI